jgi:prolyl 4-hydroxylase
MEKTEYHKDIFVIDNFLSGAECAMFMERAEQMGFEAAKVNVGGNRQQSMTSVRNNERIMFEDQALAMQLFERAKSFLVEKVGNYVACGLNELFRFYKYSPGQRFKMHRDGSFERNEKELSYYTFMVYLNEGFVGGATEFENICTVNPKQGSLLIFYHPIRHEGKLLIEGQKYVLRSDVMYKLESA